MLTTGPLRNDNSAPMTVTQDNLQDGVHTTSSSNIQDNSDFWTKRGSAVVVSSNSTLFSLTWYHEGAVFPLHLSSLYSKQGLT